MLSEKQLVELIDKAIKDFQGHSDSLSGAIGYLMIGRKFGWRVMFFIHSQSKVRKYEKILGIDSREVMPEIGPMARKAVVWQALQKVSNFWKAVKGEVAGIKSKEILKSR
jgi:hypothetical protein